MYLSRHSITIMLPISIYLYSRVLGSPQLCYHWNILFPSRLVNLELEQVTDEIPSIS